MNAFELTVLDWLQAHLRTGVGDAILVFVSRLGDAGAIWIVLCVALLLIRRTRKLGAAMACALLLDVVLTNVLLKPLVSRVRPFALNPAVQLITAPPGDASFPSGHTAAAAAACTPLFLQKSRLRWPACTLAVLMALSRLYLYMHYPTDVLGGAGIGILAGLAGTRLAAWAERRCAERIRK